jgi:uncharacterized membrane-anchored protein
MKQEPLTKLSIEELKVKEKSLMTAAGMLSGVMIVMLAAGIYMFFQKGFGVFSVIPIAFLPLVGGLFAKIKDIRAEIATRNNTL